MSGFNNPVVGGLGELIRQDIQSQNYAAGLAGWIIKKDGSAEFNNVDIRGTFSGNDYVLNSNGFFLYNGTEAIGTLAFAIAVAAGTDTFGNPYDQGYNVISIAGLTNAFAVLDTLGNTLASIDTAGNVTGLTLTANVDVIVAGQSVNLFMVDSPSGIINRGWTPSGPWPTTALGSTETSLLELDTTVFAGRAAKFSLIPSDVLMTTAPTSATQFVMRMRFTNDGTTPTTASAEVSGHSPGIVEVAPTLQNVTTPYMEWIPPTPNVDTLYRILISAFLQNGACRFQNSLEARWEDLGLDTGQVSNNGVVLGAGSGGGSGAQTYTEYFYPSTTWSYDTSFGLVSTNGNMFHGAYQGDPGWRYSYIQFGSGSRGNSLNTVLNYTVNSVKLRLKCLHSWYNSGMRFGFHSSTVLGSVPGGMLNPGGTFISEGAMNQWTLSSSQWSPFKAGGTTYLALAPDGAHLTDLGWYGFFYGGGGSNSYMPQLAVNYTH